MLLPGEPYGQRSLAGYSPRVARVGYDLGLSFFLSSPAPVTLAWGFPMLLPERQSYWSNSSTHTTTIQRSRDLGHRHLHLHLSCLLCLCFCPSVPASLVSLQLPLSSLPGWALFLLRTESDPIWPSPGAGKGTSTAEGLRQMQGASLVGHLVNLPPRSWSRASWEQHLQTLRPDCLGPTLAPPLTGYALDNGLGSL